MDTGSWLFLMTAAQLLYIGALVSLVLSWGAVLATWLFMRRRSRQNPGTWRKYILLIIALVSLVFFLTINFIARTFFGYDGTSFQMTYLGYLSFWIFFACIIVHVHANRHNHER